MRPLSVVTPYIRRMVATLAGRRTNIADQSAGIGGHDHYLDEALVLDRSGRPDEAELVLRHGLAQHTSDVNGAARLGQLLLARERFTDAVGVLATVIQAAPNRAASLAPLLSELSNRGVADAELLLRRVADRIPYDVLANHLVGERLIAAGQQAAALEHFRRVADAEQTDVDCWLYQGIALFRLGRIDAAEELLRRFVAVHPDHVDAAAHLGQLLIARKLFADALAVLASAVEATPDRAASLTPLLSELSSRGVTDADKLLLRVAESLPDDILANHVAGERLMAVGQRAAAAELFRRVADVRPSVDDHWLYKGMALISLGQPEEAEAALRHFLTLRPNHFDGTVALARALIEASGDTAESLALLASVIAAVPAEGVVGFGWLILLLAGRGTAETEPLLLNLAENHAASVPTMYDLASVAYRVSMPAWACVFITKARQVADSAEFRLCHDFLLPFVPAGEEDVEYWVRRFQSNLATLSTSGLRLSSPQDLFIQPPAIALFGYGINTRDLCQSVVRVWQVLCPGLDWVAPHCTASRVDSPHRRIRIGFLTQPTFPLLWGIASELDRSRFEVVLLVLESFHTAQPTNWSSAADRQVIVPGSGLAEARKAIADEALDVLIHTPWSGWYYFLSHARLAPVQCVLCEPAWTDGVPNLDYYISWEPAEPTQLHEHYVSPVALMTRPPYWLDRDYTRQVAAQRDEFPLPQQAHWYLCPVHPLKMHFIFDRIIVRLLQADPQGILILLRGDSPLTQLVARRLRGALGPLANRLHILPTLPEDRCHALLGIADAVLDGWPIGGMSSSYAAIHAGIPTVTLPSNMVFGRWLTAFYEAIGVTDLIATDEAHYVELAVRLASDPQWRQEIAARIKARNAVLIEDRAAVRELETFLTAATAAARQGQPARNWKAGGFVD